MQGTDRGVVGVTKSDRDKLIVDNMGLVKGVLCRFGIYTNSRDHDDCHSCGLLGLVNAADRFNPSHGVCFSTFADVLISGEIKTFLRKQKQTARLERDGFSFGERAERDSFCHC